MTRMMTLEKEYKVEAVAYFPVSITKYINAAGQEEAEEEFNRMCDDGEFNEVYNENKPGFPDIEIVEIELLETNQER